MKGVSGNVRFAEKRREIVGAKKTRVNAKEKEKTQEKGKNRRK